MFLDNMTKEQMLELNIPTGVPLIHDFDDAGNILSKEDPGQQPYGRYEPSHAGLSNTWS